MYLPSYNSTSLGFTSFCKHKEADPSMFQVGTSCVNYFQLGTATGCTAACTEVVEITIIMLFLDIQREKMSVCLGGFV